MSDLELKHQAGDLLGGLGSCRTDVAIALRNVGVRGIPKDSQDCAVAVYLRAVLGTDPRVQSFTVGRVAVKLHTSERRQWTHRPSFVRVRLPDPVRQFISAFDEGFYPDLIREGGEPPRVKFHPAEGATIVPAAKPDTPVDLV